MIRTNFITHLAAAAVITILAGLIYGAAQQTYRSTANDPQLQISRDISNKTGDKLTAGEIPVKDSVEISSSLAPFIIFYNEKGEPVKGTGVLDGRLPRLPGGTFDFAKKKAENVFTWQPRRGVRVAMVLRSLSSSPYSYVATGRSLYEVEKRERNLLWMCITGWLLCMAVLLFHWLILQIRK